MCSPEIPKQRNLCCCEVDADIHLASLPVFTVLCSGILDTVECCIFPLSAFLNSSDLLKYPVSVFMLNCLLFHEFSS